MTIPIVFAILVAVLLGLMLGVVIVCLTSGEVDRPATGPPPPAPAPAAGRRLDCVWLPRGGSLGVDLVPMGDLVLTCTPRRPRGSERDPRDRSG